MTTTRDDDRLPSPAPAQGVSPRQLRWLIAGLMLGLFLSATEQSVVATALPTVAGELGGARHLSWVVAAYLLTSTVVTPLYGKLSDLFGRRVVYQASISIFIVGSLLCGAAQTMMQLVGARAIQGIGGGGLMSLAFVIMGDVLSPRDRGRYMGWFTGVFAFASISGPFYGGFLVDQMSWRWIFLLMLPLGLTALAVTSHGLKLPFHTIDRPIDIVGALLLITGATALLLVAVWGGSEFAWGSPQILGLVLFGLAITGVFLRWEATAEEPILPLRLFTNRSVSAIYGLNFILMFTITAVSTFLPLFLQVARGATATGSGIQVIPQSVTISLTAAIVGNLVSRYGRYKWAMVAGPAIAFVGMMAISTIGLKTSAAQLAPSLILMGFGLGLVFPNLTLAVQNAVEPGDLGAGTSTGNFFRSMGATFGAAIMGSVLNSRLNGQLTTRLSAERLAELGGAGAIIRAPAQVKLLPDDVRQAVAESVAAAVTGTIRIAAPALLGALVLALVVKELPLRTSSALGGPNARQPLNQNRAADQRLAGPLATPAGE